MRPSLPRSLSTAVLAFALALPFAAPRAATDCASLDIALDVPELSKFTCDSGSFSGGGPSRTEEGILASGPGALFIVRHAAAGVRTYFERRDTRSFVDDGSVFATIENWTAAPGGNQFMVARFEGHLLRGPDVTLYCFAFSRFTGHIARTTGFRHILYGFYCTDDAERRSDADVRRLIEAVKFDFE